MTQDSRRVRVVERNKERGSTMILTAFVLPVLVLFAGLGIGGAVVRSSADETQRTANLTAAAAAAQVPTLGRPTYDGLPEVPSDYEMPLPPGVPFDPNVSFSPNSVYETELAAAAQIDKDIAIQSGVGPLFTSALGAIGAPWDKGCRVGQAQYEQRRARMSSNFARAAGMTPLCPAVQPDGSVIYPGDPDERIYVRPEMESTGAYRLQLCFVNPVNCALFFGQGATGVLNAIGQDYSAQVPVDLSLVCAIDPTDTGCMFDGNTLQNALNLGADQAQGVEDAVRAQYDNAVGSVPDPLKDQLVDLGALLFGQLTPEAACNIQLGPASGQTLCGAGVNLASLLPSVMTPRVRTVVHHAIDVPLVPDLANGNDAGDFDFTGHALARRTFKNAVVVPTLPAQFGVQQSVCLRGETLLEGLPEGVPVALNTLRTLVSGLPALPLPTTADPTQCPNAEVDHTIDETDQVAPVDLNQTLLDQQQALIGMAIQMNDIANRSTNGVIAAALNAEDGGQRTASDCSLNKDTNPNGPAPWCVDMGGQMIRDVRDIYDPPGSGGAPTAQEVLKGAVESGEPVEMMALGKQIPVELNPPVRMPDGTTVSKLTYWVPALDFVPALVTCFFDEDAQVYIRPVGEPQDADLPCDLDNPFASTFKLVEDASGPKGLYRAVLIHPNASGSLCTYPLNDPQGRCIDQPKATITVPPLPLPTSTTAPTLPVTVPPTSTTTSTTLPLPLPTLPPTTSTTLPLPLPTLPPSPTTTIKIGLP